MMIRLVLVIAVFQPFYACMAAEENKSLSARVIERYLELPHPEEDRLGKSRIARLEVLRELESMSDDAVNAILNILPIVKNPAQRAELVATLRKFETEESAAILIKMLKDPDDKVRGKAIHCLRLFARRTNRFGPKRQVRESDFEPKVKGLVPHLIAAADDKEERNRVFALYALADTRDPAAVDELRKRLKDPSSKVRLKAACLLTEFNDASGLPEMRSYLEQLRTSDRKDDLRLLHAGMLLASFERITGKSFGPIPMSPYLFSDLSQIEKAIKQYDYLIDTWTAWWAWEPTTNNQ